MQMHGKSNWGKYLKLIQALLYLLNLEQLLSGAPLDTARRRDRTVQPPGGAAAAAASR